ncbi:DUF4405 domain-containing protein [Sporomusa sp. KB1]|jgi:hypothetical protein|uniref:DUF4405 domain-containing protein n=1 Tax=Sporomusa sp. KB1 TaxID=943346 RepID=UPI00119E39FC|nr:DUF4405 domain-containing protein [Sporomusa sp. KB1]TWH47712.1 uncharacterized protein DUF4405 [Sporomusa sp. KB1]
MRRFTSIILALAFILVSITGLQMTGGGGHGPGNAEKYQTVQSQQAGSNTAGNNSAEPRQKSFYPKVAHEWGGYVFIIAGLVHLGLNLKPMKSYLMIKS